MKKTFDWCILQGYREFNPADDVAVMTLPRSRRAVKHHAAVEHRDTERYIDLIRGLTSHDSSLRLAFEFTVLTGVRHGEGFGVRWGEIHLDYEVFTPKNPKIPPLIYPCLVIPAGRMKSGEEAHVVPLSRQALKLLVQALPLRDRHPVYIFPTKNGRTNPPTSTLKLRKKTKQPGTTHGFRATLVTWAQTFSVPSEIAEISLAHKVKGVRGAYARSILLANRIYLMQNYADYHSNLLAPEYIWKTRFIPEDPITYPDIPDLSPEEWAALKEATQSNPDFTLFEDVQKAFKTIRLSSEDPSIVLAMLFMALTASRPALVLRALSSEVDMETGMWSIPRNHNAQSGQEFGIPLSRAARAVVARACQDSDLLFPSRTGEAIHGSALNNLCRTLKLCITPMSLRTAFTL